MARGDKHNWGGLRSPAGGRPKDHARYRPWVECGFSYSYWHKIGGPHMTLKEQAAFVRAYLDGKLARLPPKPPLPLTVNQQRRLQRELEEADRLRWAGGLRGRPRAGNDIPSVQMDFYYTNDADKPKKSSAAQKQQEALEFARRHGLPGYK
jgi:hypothetical protein